MLSRKRIFFPAILAVIALLLTATFLTGSALAAGSLKLSSIAAAQTPTDDDDDDDDDDGTGCAAAYLLGENDPRLDTLRQFRDDVLAKSAVGQKLIQLYYANSAAIIVALEQNPQLKQTAQGMLETIVANGALVSSVAAAQTPTDDDDDDDDGTGCAAAYLLGENDPRLDTLRQFRDDVLAKSVVGQKLIQLYYANSNAIIAMLEQNPQLKQTAKAMLASIAR